jgi:hypothetical protein
MNKPAFSKFAVVLLALVVYPASSISGIGDARPLAGNRSLNAVHSSQTNSLRHKLGQHLTAREMDKKICLELSFEDKSTATRSLIAKVKLTNCSEKTLAAADFSGISFILSKRPVAQRYSIIGEEFATGFSKKQFSPVKPVEIPNELKGGESFEFKVDFWKGVWVDRTSSITGDENNGMYAIPKGLYYANAEINLAAPAECEKCRVLFQSNEVEVTLR